MQDDATLLRRYAETRSNEAFTELVRRHLNLVYSAALRQVGGDAHLAEDVAQSVFHDLARKAAALVHAPVLAGWLHTSTHYAAAKVVRTERRRRAREAEANTMQEILNDSPRDAEWARIRPVLDEALRRLKPRDRDAILLRFFEGEAFTRIGARLSLTENAARMRVERALEKLREQLTQRGISSTSAALATALANQAVTAAPGPLAMSVANAALVGAAGSGAAVSFFQLMAITKTQAVLAGALLLGGGTAVVLQQREQTVLRDEIAALDAQNAQITRTEEANLRLARAATEATNLRLETGELPRLREEIATLRNKERTNAAARTAASSHPSRPTATPGENKPAGTADHMATVKTQVAPVYPAEFVKSGISGEAVVKVVIDSKGDVQDASIVRSTHREFETAALDAVKKWKFDPGMKGGRNVNTTVQVPIVFQVDPDEPDWF